MADRPAHPEVVSRPLGKTARSNPKRPSMTRLYLLADHASGQVDPFAIYETADAAAADGEKTEHVALYKFVGYRGRGKREGG